MAYSNPRIATGKIFMDRSSPRVESLTARIRENLVRLTMEEEGNPFAKYFLKQVMSGEGHEAEIDSELWGFIKDVERKNMKGEVTVDEMVKVASVWRDSYTSSISPSESTLRKMSRLQAKFASPFPEFPGGILQLTQRCVMLGYQFIGHVPEYHIRPEEDKTPLPEKELKVFMAQSAYRQVFHHNRLEDFPTAEKFLRYAEKRRQVLPWELITHIQPQYLLAPGVRNLEKSAEEKLVIPSASFPGLPHGGKIIYLKDQIFCISESN
jgi:hypothetical protein